MFLAKDEKGKKVVLITGRAFDVGGIAGSKCSIQTYLQSTVTFISLPPNVLIVLLV